LNNNQKAVVFLKDFLQYLFKLDTTQPHEEIKFHIVNYLELNGFRAFAEYGVSAITRKDSKDEEHRGRLDFYGVSRNMQIVGEIDRSAPKKRSIEKCSKYRNALKIFVLRGDKIKYSETERRTQNIKKYVVIDLKGRKVIFSDMSQETQNDRALPDRAQRFAPHGTHPNFCVVKTSLKKILKVRQNRGRDNEMNNLKPLWEETKRRTHDFEQQLVNTYINFLRQVAKHFLEQGRRVFFRENTVVHWGEWNFGALLIQGDEDVRDVFGDHVSEVKFKKEVEKEAEKGYEEITTENLDMIRYQM